MTKERVLPLNELVEVWFGPLGTVPWRAPSPRVEQLLREQVTRQREQAAALARVRSLHQRLLNQRAHRWWP